MSSGRRPYAQSLDGAASGLFRHGVASGDPLTDRVILWTRVTPGPGSTRRSMFAGASASDRGGHEPIVAGHVRTTSDRDFTVKVDAAGPAAGPPVLLRVRPRRRAIAGRPHADAARRRRRPRPARVSLLLQLPVGLLQRLPLRRQPHGPRRRPARRRLHLRVRERHLRRRQRAAAHPRAAARSRHAERLPHPLRHLSHRSGPAGGASPATRSSPSGTTTSSPTTRGRTAPRITIPSRARATGRRARRPPTARISNGCRCARRAGSGHPSVPQLPVRRPASTCSMLDTRGLARPAGGNDESAGAGQTRRARCSGAAQEALAVRRSCARRSAPEPLGGCSGQQVMFSRLVPPGTRCCCPIRGRDTRRRATACSICWRQSAFATSRSSAATCTARGRSTCRAIPWSGYQARDRRGIARGRAAGAGDQLAAAVRGTRTPRARAVAARAPAAPEVPRGRQPRLRAARHHAPAAAG